MCFSDLQVDLVGSEKLNNSMGFSMFFVGLGCLTGPPLAGEWIMTWKTFKRRTHVNLLFHVHTTAYMKDCSYDLLHRGQGEVCTRLSVFSCVCWPINSWKKRVREWRVGTVKSLITLCYEHIFLGGCCSTYFHGALNTFQCLPAYMSVCVSVKTQIYQVSAVLSADWDFGVALKTMCLEFTGSNVILPTVKWKL